MAKRKSTPRTQKNNPPHSHSPGDNRRESKRGRKRDEISDAKRHHDHWIYGTHAALAALNNPARKCMETRLTRGFAEAHPDRAELVGAMITERDQLDTLLPEGAVHQGIAVKTHPLPDIAIEDILGEIPPDARACIAVLDQATDPRNIGAVLRSAAAFGVKALVMQDRHAPPETGTMAKAASGALEHVPIVRVTNLARAMEAMKDADFWCVGLDGYAEKTLSEITLDNRTALIFGAEGKGMRRLTQENCDLTARIPLSPDVESLNLANAVSITLYEWAR